MGFIMFGRGWGVVLNVEGFYGFFLFIECLWELDRGEDLFFEDFDFGDFKFFFDFKIGDFEFFFDKWYLLMFFF